MFIGEQGELLKLFSGRCKSCKFERVCNATDFLEPAHPSLLFRLFQATLLLEMTMDYVVHSSLIPNSSNERCSLEKDISQLAVDLHKDRCRGAEVNCSVLAVCVRCVVLLATQRNILTI